METEDLPENNAPLTVNEQVFVSYMSVTKTQMYLNISSHVHALSPMRVSVQSTFTAQAILFWL